MVACTSCAREAVASPAGSRSEPTPVVRGTGRQTGPQIAPRTAAASAEVPHWAIVGQVCPRNRIGQSSESLPSRHPGKVFRQCRTNRNSGTRVNARGSAYPAVVSCTLVAKQATNLRLATADNAPDTNTEGFTFLQDLQEKQRADERTRTADLVSLRVCGQRLLSVAEGCKSRISKRFFVPSIAHDCRVLRPG
jgi:hypothetical protein